MSSFPKMSFPAAFKSDLSPSHKASRILLISLSFTIFHLFFVLELKLLDADLLMDQSGRQAYVGFQTALDARYSLIHPSHARATIACCKNSILSPNGRQPNVVAVAEYDRLVQTTTRNVLK